jgi:DNA-binding response OmpR family regulator
MQKKVAIVEDEAELATLIEYNLARGGFQTRIFNGSGATVRDLDTWQPDLIVLDVMLPEQDGFEICRQLRQGGRLKRTPVVFLTAKSDEVDRVLGLEIGGDDYITKPFSPREVVARVKAVLRRSASQQETPQLIRSGELSIDLNGHEVKYAGARIALTATEFRILQFLAGRPGRVFSRDEIIDAALDSDTAVFDRTVDVHITAIRKKLGAGGELIETVRGFGYKFQANARSENTVDAGARA